MPPASEAGLRPSLLLLPLLMRLLHQQLLLRPRCSSVVLVAGEAAAPAAAAAAAAVQWLLVVVAAVAAEGQHWLLVPVRCSDWLTGLVPTQQAPAVPTVSVQQQRVREGVSEKGGE